MKAFALLMAPAKVAHVVGRPVHVVIIVVVVIVTPVWYFCEGVVFRPLIETHSKALIMIRGEASIGARL